MSNPVNLNRFRKSKEKAERKAQADRNAVIHGLPKSEKTRAEKSFSLDSKRLDQKKFTRDEGDT